MAPPNAPRRQPRQVLGLNQPAPEAIRDPLLEQRLALSADVEQPLQRNAIDFVNAAEEIRAQFAEKGKVMPEELEAIIAGLMDPRPAKGEEPTPSLNRYLTAEKTLMTNGETIYRYNIIPDVVAADLKDLETLKSLNPDLAPQFGQIITSLKDYARRDARMASFETNQKRMQSVTSKGLGEMAQMSVVIAGVAMTAITTFIMIANRKFSFVPFFYMAITGLAASKKFRNAVGDMFGADNELFGSKLGRALEETDIAINKSGFIRLAQQYNIQGDEWNTIVASLMTEDPERTAILAQLNGRAAPPADVDAYVAAQTSDPNTADALRRMILSGDYSKLHNCFSDVGKDESKVFIADYVKTGAWQFAPKKK